MRFAACWVLCVGGTKKRALCRYFSYVTLEMQNRGCFPEGGSGLRIQIPQKAINEYWRVVGGRQINNEGTVLDVNLRVC